MIKVTAITYKKKWWPYYHHMFSQPGVLDMFQKRRFTSTVTLFYALLTAALVMAHHFNQAFF